MLSPFKSSTVKFISDSRGVKSLMSSVLNISSVKFVSDLRGVMSVM